MLNSRKEKDRIVLEKIARRTMTERGFLTDFSPEVMAELQKLPEFDTQEATPKKDLRDLPWSSIDNDDSLDIDQLTVAIPETDETVRILVAVADVESLAKIDSAIDAHARQNTTSVYTAGGIFPMLPDKLSTDIASLVKNQERTAIVIDITTDEAGEIVNSDIYSAKVVNHAKLAYNDVASWLEGKEPSITKIINETAGIGENIRIQDNVAQKLRIRRHERGALNLQTLESHPVFTDGEIQDLRVDVPNRAKELIADFMIAANDVTARFLKGKKIPSFRRVVRAPKRWDRIVEIAARLNFKLPANPDPKELARFLIKQKAIDPLRFPDLSLSIIKLLGSGEYIVEKPDDVSAGHFGLAVRDYTHSTAPNRRFPDLITQRILKATLAGQPLPYTESVLIELARHCTEKEDEANKVERLVAKSAAAILLSTRIGTQFNALCTGAADKGTWVRIFHPPIEGRLLRGFEHVDVGDLLTVRLIHTDIEKGFIDFEKVGSIQ
jgi:VacB/RNase II family 3'-5' exoribonuclease